MVLHVHAIIIFNNHAELVLFLEPTPSEHVYVLRDFGVLLQISIVRLPNLDVHWVLSAQIPL